MKDLDKLKDEFFEGSLCGTWDKEIFGQGALAMKREMLQHYLKRSDVVEAIEDMMKEIDYDPDSRDSIVIADTKEEILDRLLTKFKRDEKDKCMNCGKLPMSDNSTLCHKCNTLT